MSIELEDVKRLHLEPGDALVLRLATEPTWEQATRLTGHAQALFPNNRVLVLSPGMELEVVNDPTVQVGTVLPLTQQVADEFLSPAPPT